MGNAINGTVNHQVGETIKGDAPSPIIKAIQAGQLSKRLLKALLAEGANVNYSSQIYGTPLMTACSHGPLSVVELLLRHGADPMTPLKLVQNHRTHGRISYPSDPDLYALFDPVPPPPRIRLRTHWRLRIAFHVIGRRASNPRSKRHELGLYRVSDIASFLLPGE